MSDGTPGNLEQALRDLDPQAAATPPARPGHPLLEVKAELLHVNARLDQQAEDLKHQRGELQHQRGELKYLRAAIDLLLEAEKLDRPVT